MDAYDELKSGRSDSLDRVDLPDDQPVVTVCGAGKTSMLAASQLRERGWEALSLERGMMAWSSAWNQAQVPLPASEAQVVQVRRTGKGCLSYLIGSEGVAAVIDPALDPSVYLHIAEELGWTISYVLETHLHADHLSRGRLLAERSGATLYLPAQTEVAYSFVPLQDGDELKIGKARLSVLSTPGHTAESSCYLLDTQAVFTGDTLFVAGVGRPDLEAAPTQARQRAQWLHHSLQRLLALPGQTLVLPGHTGAPVAFDGIPIISDLAEIQTRIKLLQMPEDLFVETLLAGIPPAPPNHLRIIELNKLGLSPEDDPLELEAGANRCAIA